MAKRKGTTRKKSLGLNSGQAVRAQPRTSKTGEQLVAHVNGQAPVYKLPEVESAPLRYWLESRGESVPDDLDKHLGALSVDEAMQTIALTRRKRRPSVMPWFSLITALRVAISKGDMRAALIGMYRLGKEHAAQEVKIRKAAKARTGKLAKKLKISQQFRDEARTLWKDNRVWDEVRCAKEVIKSLRNRLSTSDSKPDLPDPRTVAGWIKDLDPKARKSV